MNRYYTLLDLHVLGMQLKRYALQQWHMYHICSGELLHYAVILSAEASHPQRRRQKQLHCLPHTLQQSIHHCTPAAVLISSTQGHGYNNCLAVRFSRCKPMMAQNSKCECFIEGVSYYIVCLLIHVYPHLTQPIAHKCRNQLCSRVIWPNGVVNLAVYMQETR